MDDKLLAGLRLTFKEAKEAKELSQKCYHLLIDLYSELVKAGVIKINHEANTGTMGNTGTQG